MVRARPAESEALLSYAALADIVGPVFDEVRSLLPDPQERALAVVMARAATDGPADTRTTATALVSTLVELASAVPVVLAIDDVQWLDQASARVLEFAVRRLPARLGVLATLRTGTTADVPLGLDRAVPPDRFVRLPIGPLSLAALRHVITARLHTSVTRPLLARVAEASGGNPFVALEMARNLTTTPPGEPLPLPRSISKLALERIDRLSPNAREVVLVASLLSRPTVVTITSGLSSEVDAQAAIIEAEEAGVLVTEQGRVRFDHPLLASAVSGAVSDTRRRRVHRRLADVVTDAEDRGRHMYQAAVDPDEDIAMVVETGADQAMLRGAYDASAELFEAALRLTPAARAEGRARRTLKQAMAMLKTGEVAAARGLADGVDTAGLPSGIAVERHRLLAEVEWDAGRTALSTQYLEQALEAATGDREQSAAILTRLVLVGMPAGPARALEHAEQAMHLLSEEREPQLLSSILIDRFLAGVFLGQRAQTELLERGLALEARAGRAAYPSPVPLIWFECIDDDEATIARHDREDTWARDRGDERMRAERIGYLALMHLRGGRWDLAEELCERGCDALAELEVGGRFAYAFAWRSFIDAHRGRFDRALATLRPLVEDAARVETAWWGANLLAVLAFVEFSAGRHEAVDAALTRMTELLQGLGIKEALLERTEPFRIESLVALGQLDQARVVLEHLEERGRTIPRLWIDVTLPRARAHILAAEGDPVGALAALDDIDVVPAARLPFELAQTSLLRGRLHRRLKQRRLAADAFAEARTVFERLGAPSWVAVTTDELTRVSPRRRRQTELTATEAQVAELAAAGLTNREVAQATFISAKTVEAHLASVYRKLGIHSRAQLGARVGSAAYDASPRT